MAIDKISPKASFSANINGGPMARPTTLKPRGHPPPGTGPPKGEEFFTLSNGCPIMKPQASLRVGRQLRANLLVEDTNLLEVITHMNREKIPERVVHAKGTGAWGEFEVTHDITHITSAAFLNDVGKKTRLFARFSTAGGEKGSADSVRDARGFAFKFYTEEGNLDWVFLSPPAFFIRDPAKFPSLFHAIGRNPGTGRKDPNIFFDYFNNNSEGYHALMHLFSDTGTPSDFRHTDIFGVNTYRFTKEDGSFHYVKIHLKTDQGVRNLTQAEAVKLTATDPDHNARDLFEAIDKGDFPSWTVYAQVIRPHTAEHLNIDIFDPTKTISQEDFPLIPFGKITLNENPANFFAEMEQAAFSPANVVPGWDITPDPVLQIRLFAYGDTQRYRLGVNFNQLHTNRPFYSFNPTKRDGVSNISNLGALPNYIPSSFGPRIAKAEQFDQPSHEEWIGKAVAFQSDVTDADFIQPREVWKELGKERGQQKNFVANVASLLSLALEEIREATYEIFRRIDKHLGNMIEDETEKLVMGTTTCAGWYQQELKERVDARRTNRESKNGDGEETTRDFRPKKRTRTEYNSS